MARPLSLLDLTYIAAGSNSGETVQRSVRMAQLAEKLGYQRVWYAEHHNTRGLASGSPEIMIAHVAAHTSTIRLGSGGVMLPNQAPLKVAETFHLLEAMHPGRIDLGLGRAPGTDTKTSLALRRNPDALSADDYPQNVLELLAYDERTFPEGHYFENIIATPADQKLPPVWLLGSSGFSGQFAAQIGVAFSFAAHINKPLAIDVMRAYRAQFQPSARLAAPNAMLAVGTIVAENEERVKELALIHRVGMYRLLTGAMREAPTLEEAREIVSTIPPQYQMQIDSMQANQFMGTPDQVAAQVKAFADEAEADEVMFTSTISSEADLDFAIRAMKSAWDEVDL
ncbi:MAG: LLM class flavin-dependent oxidoreductase [Thermomicrobiales bacterium]|nr:LLM class flavin-dependent oxidoreductase [Thermomicrobiales bacterium]MCO5218515.1 LLM class flavin-dependent oxidoreductase [Thermomicrobiales bacterium]MCO5224803.1 LLM class flavin-dependent oxidoreductase [Thermomicrobiales bacterium]MCO5227615.1 LLM class flavin-dependent oxidoreductase [Thermomicrobiales bacterium]